MTIRKTLLISKHFSTFPSEAISKNLKQSQQSQAISSNLKQSKTEVYIDILFEYPQT